jgi:hypothetical protein
LSGLFHSFAPVARLGLNLGKKLISSPLAQKVGSAAMEAAKKTAVNIAADAMSGHNVRESAQRELRDAKEKIATTLRAGRKKRLNEASKRLKKKKNSKQIVKNKKKKYCILD